MFYDGYFIPFIRVHQGILQIFQYFLAIDIHDTCLFFTMNELTMIHSDSMLGAGKMLRA
jgi:hypothetical protein